MMISSWRIVKKKYANAAMSGEGARLYGGRWNSIGVSMIYTASTKSLAALEMLVHLPSQELLRQYVVIQVQFQKSALTLLDLSNLASNWDQDPPRIETQRLGDEWAKSLTSTICQVPSAIIKNECNYLINPKHPAFKDIVTGDPLQFLFDQRLLKS